MGAFIFWLCVGSLVAVIAYYTAKGFAHPRLSEQEHSRRRWAEKIREIKERALEEEAEPEPLPDLSDLARYWGVDEPPSAPPATLRADGRRP